MVDPKNVLLEFLSHWPEDVSRLGHKSLEDDFEFLYLVIKKQDRLDVVCSCAEYIIMSYLLAFRDPSNIY